MEPSILKQFPHGQTLGNSGEEKLYLNWQIPWNRPGLRGGQLSDSTGQVQRKREGEREERQRVREREREKRKTNGRGRATDINRTTAKQPKLL